MREGKEQWELVPWPWRRGRQPARPHLKLAMFEVLEMSQSLPVARMRAGVLVRVELGKILSAAARS